MQHKCSPTNFFRFSKIVVSSLDLHLVVHGVALPVAAALDDLVSVLRHGGELVDGGGKLLHADAALLLQEQDAARLGVHIIILVLELLLGLVHLGGGRHHLLHDLLQPGLELLDPLACVSDVGIEPVTVSISRPGVLLELIDLCVHFIGLRLEKHCRQKCYKVLK